MKLQTFYLDASSKRLSPKVSPSASEASYLASDMKSEIHFDLIFDKHTELAGYPKLKLWMSCKEHEDIDVYVLLSKIGKNKEPMLHVNFKPTVIPRDKLPKTNVIQYQGPTGFLRASHRDWAPAGPSYAEPLPLGNNEFAASGKSSGQWDGTRELWHPHVTKRPVPRGDVVELQFTTWPIGVVYEEGEGLRLRISGRDMCFIEDAICEYFALSLSCLHFHPGFHTSNFCCSQCIWIHTHSNEIELIKIISVPVNKTQNIGTHFVHTGGKYNSSIDLPVLHN